MRRAVIAPTAGIAAGVGAVLAALALIVAGSSVAAPPPASPAASVPRPAGVDTIDQGGRPGVSKTVSVEPVPTTLESSSSDATERRYSNGEPPTRSH